MAPSSENTCRESGSLPGTAHSGRFTFSTAGAMQGTRMQNVTQLNVYLSTHKQAGYYSCMTIEQQSVDYNNGFMLFRMLLKSAECHVTQIYCIWRKSAQVRQTRNRPMTCDPPQPVRLRPESSCIINHSVISIRSICPHEVIKENPESSKISCQPLRDIINHVLYVYSCNTVQ